MKILLLIGIFFINLSALTLELDGKVESQNEKMISSKMMGYIKKVYVNEGDTVKKGDILYEIDDANFSYNSKILKEQIKNVKLNLSRYKNLLDQDLVSKYEYEQIELNLSILNSKLAELEAQYEYLRVKAPNNGVILKKSIKEDEMATMAMPHIILSDLDSLIIKTNVSETALKDIKVKQKVRVKVPSQNYEDEGEILAIFPNLYSNTHSFVVKIKFDKKDFNIFPNMYAKIYINTGSQND